MESTTTSDLSPKKTMLVLVIVVGCFAVLWPKVFYPMLVGSAQQRIRPSDIDKTTGCCDVFSEIDVNTIKILSELCGSIIKTNDSDGPLKGKEIVEKCKKEILNTCGIDISPILQDHVRLGQNVKQILSEIRSLNGSLCLKYNYGVSPWALGVGHKVTVQMSSTSNNIRQERPLHLRSEMIHPAFRERGRAIPQPQTSSPSRPPPRIVEGRPGPIPGMRPTIGGAGHVVPPSKQGTSSMSIIMPIYTIGIVVFFTYTLMRIMFKKQPEGPGGSLYPPITPDPHFRKEVFESDMARLRPRLSRDNISSKLVVNAMSALLDEVDQELEARRKSSEGSSQDLLNSNLLNGNAHKVQDEEQAHVTVLGMEMTASCEGGKKWLRPDSPPLPSSSHISEIESTIKSPPQEIYLEGSLPSQSQLLVADSATETQSNQGDDDDPAVVLAGKMTLSVVSLDSSENGNENNSSGSSWEDLGKENEKECVKISDNNNEEKPLEKELIIEKENLELNSNNVTKQIDELMNEIVPKSSEIISLNITEQVNDLVKEIEKDAVENIINEPLISSVISSNNNQKSKEITPNQNIIKTEDIKAVEAEKMEDTIEENANNVTEEIKVLPKEIKDSALEEDEKIEDDLDEEMDIEREIVKQLEHQSISREDENRKMLTEQRKLTTEQLSSQIEATVESSAKENLNIESKTEKSDEDLNERLIMPKDEKEVKEEQKNEEKPEKETKTSIDTEKLLEDIQEQIKLQEKLLLEDDDIEEIPKETPPTETVEEDEEVEEEEEVSDDESERGELVQVEEIVFESDSEDEYEDKPQTVNGNNVIEESKETTGNNAADDAASQDELTDDEEIIEVEETDEEEEDEEVEEEADLQNHIANNEH